MAKTRTEHSDWVRCDKYCLLYSEGKDGLLGQKKIRIEDAEKLYLFRKGIVVTPHWIKPSEPTSTVGGKSGFFSNDGYKPLPGSARRLTPPGRLHEISSRPPFSSDFPSFASEFVSRTGETWAVPQGSGKEDA